MKELGHKKEKEKRGQKSLLSLGRPKINRKKKKHKSELQFPLVEIPVSELAVSSVFMKLSCPPSYRFSSFLGFPPVVT